MLMIKPISTRNYTGNAALLLLICLLFSTTGLFAQAPNISYQTPQIYSVNENIPPLVPANTGGAVPATIYGQVTTFVGSAGTPGYTDGTGTSATFNHPARLCQDKITGNLYMADRDNNLIRKITPAGVVTTFAYGFNQPNDVVMDASGNLFVADAATNSIKKVSPDGTVSVLAGGNMGFSNGQGTLASFYYPYGLNIDANGNLYVADSQNNAIRKITTDGTVTTFAGNGGAGNTNGTGLNATFNDPNSVALDAAGNFYVGDSKNNEVRKITPAGVVTTFAGTGIQGNQDGTVANATFYKPGGVAIDPLGNTYISDVGNYTIRKVDPQGKVTTVAGTGVIGTSDGIGTAASFTLAYGLKYDASGFLYIVDLGAHNVRKMILTGYTIDKALPPGLTFDQKTGIISGTPTSTWPTTIYTISAYNGAGVSTTTVSLTVQGPLAFAPIPAKRICDADFTVEVSGGSGTYSYSIADLTVATISASGVIHILKAGTTTVKVSDGISTLTQTLTVNPGIVPTISVSLPNYSTSCAGMPITFTATVTNQGTKPTYQWMVNGQPAAGAANSTTFTSTTLNSYDKVYCILTNTTDCTAGPVTSNTVINGEVDQYVTPTISIQPSVTGTIASTTNITFTATVTHAGDSPIYQWMVNGEDVGTNQPTYTANCFHDGDVVTCNLTNQGGACLTTLFATSNAVTIQVSAAASITVNITSSAQIIDYGTLVNFNATIAGGTPQAYQWQINGNNAGTNSSTFSSTVLNNVDAVTCSATVNNGCTVLVVSNTISMTVNPVLTLTVPNKTACDADFPPDATGGTGNYTYTSSNPAVATINGGKIHITGAGTSTITANDGLTSQSQTLTVSAAIVPTVVVSLPDPSASCAGTPITFTTTATNQGSNPTYVWMVNAGVAIGATGPTYTSTTLKTGDKVSCLLTNTTDCTIGSVSSNTVTVGEVDPYVTPTISIASSVTGAVAPATVITFTATTNNAGTGPNYQWHLNGVNVGGNNPTYVNNCFNDGDVVDCTLTYNGGKCTTTLTANSNQLKVAVTVPAITVVITASSNNVYKGANVIFTAHVNNGTPQAYQWQVNGSNAGTNSDTFTTNALQNGDVVTCVVMASNGCTLSVVSNKIAMTVYTPLAIAIPNTFTPNGDGINDQWQIEELKSYPNCIVEVFTRYGTKVFHSKGYGIPWDGTFKGAQLSNGTYYYVIDLGMSNTPKLSGFIALLR